VTEPLLRELAALPPDEWLAPNPAVGGPAEQREAYVRYLMTRLRSRDALVDAVEEVRHAA
jgi:hypothetical protein